MASFSGYLDADQKKTYTSTQTCIKCKQKYFMNHPKQTLFFHIAKRRKDRETTLNLSNQDYIFKAPVFLYPADLL